MTDTNHTIYQKLATDHLITINQVKAFAKLFDDGASVPFIARYRKEQTGGLDDTVLRSLEKTLVFERDLAQYRQTVRELIANQTTLTDELITHINQATSKLELDDIYQPYRPRRRSVSGRAKLAGLLPVAQAVLAGADPQIPWQALAALILSRMILAKSLLLTLVIITSKSQVLKPLF